MAYPCIGAALAIPIRAEKMRHAPEWTVAASLALAVMANAACRSERFSSDANGEITGRAASAPDTHRADSVLRAAMSDPRAWPDYGRDHTNQRWSPLTQIDTTTVARLRLAWVNHSGIPHASETNPVVTDSTMYFTTALNHVLAVDARTGAKRWEFAYDYQGRTVVDCCSTNNKGVAVYGGRVIMATVDARLVALDARTGALLWETQVGDNEQGYHMTGAPIVVEGRVITGVSGGEQGCRCYLDAYDASTGKRLWRWYSIPSPTEGGWWGSWRAADPWGMSFHRDIARERADSAKYADAWQHGGGPVWHHPAYDPALGLLFVNVGNAAPDNAPVASRGTISPCTPKFAALRRTAPKLCGLPTPSSQINSAGALRGRRCSRFERLDAGARRTSKQTPS